MTIRWNEMQPGELSSGVDNLLSRLDRTLNQLQRARNIVHDVNSNGALEPGVTPHAPSDTLAAPKPLTPAVRSSPSNVLGALPPVPTSRRNKRSKAKKTPVSVAAEPRCSLESDLRRVAPLGTINASAKVRRDVTNAYDKLIRLGTACIEAQNIAAGAPMSDDLAASLVEGHVSMFAAYTVFFALEAPFASEGRFRLLQLGPQAIDHLIMLFAKARRTTSSEQHIGMRESLLQTSRDKLQLLMMENPSHVGFWKSTDAWFELSYDTLRANSEMARQVYLSTERKGSALRAVFENLMAADEECLGWDVHFKMAVRHGDGCLQGIVEKNEKFHLNIHRYFAAAAKIPALQAASRGVAQRSVKRIVDLLAVLKLGMATQRKDATALQVDKSLTVIDSIYIEMEATCPAYASVWSEVRQALEQASSGTNDATSGVALI